MRTKIITIFACLILGVIIFSGFYPFEFKPKNNVDRLTTGNGIVIDGNALIYENADRTSFSILSYISGANGLSIEVLVKPYTAGAKKLTGILCFYDENDPDIFMIAKWKSNLILRRRILLQNKTFTYHEENIKNVLFSDSRNFITITINDEGTHAYIDGKEIGFFPKYTIEQNRNFFPHSRMILGNEPRIKAPWAGEINGLAIYNTVLKAEEVSRHYSYWSASDYQSLSKSRGIISLYPVNERSGPLLRNSIANRNNFIISGYLFAIKRSILAKPWTAYWRYDTFYYDIIINVLGFIPAGFFILLFLFSLFGTYSARHSIITVLIGSCISLFIELVQVFMPARTSSLTDLICNITGTAIGVVLFRLLQKRIPNIIKKPG